MARIRTIKPEFQNSQSMGRISRDARLTFIELWPQCDDAGRIRANSRMLASVLFPYDLDAPNLIDGWLSELETEGCIVRYRVEKDEYLQIIHWDHQKIDHPQPSKLPAPPSKKSKKTKLIFREETTNVREDSSDVRAVSSTVSRKGKDQGSALARFDEFWNACPKKTARGAAEKAWPKALAQADADTLIAAMKTYAATQAGKEAAYIKTPGPWLNEKRWLDDGIAPKATLDVASLREQRERAARLNLPTDRIDRAIEEAEARAA